MNLYFATASYLLIALQIALPRKWAAIPILIAGLHLPNHLVTGDFTTVRALIVIGIAKAVITGGFSKLKTNRIDILFIVLSLWILLSSIGHNPGYNPYTERLGFIINITGSYFLFRLILSDIDEVKALLKILPILVLPLAILITMEKQTGINQYHPLGTIKEAGMRNDKIRAQASFNHPILAGTIGACFIPLAFALGGTNKKRRNLLYISGCAIALASTSSGPFAISLTSFILLWLYKKRSKIPKYRTLAITGLLLLHFVIMKRPVWYILAEIDLAGGSTGWHRAHLINQAIEYIGEWWLFGTDFTRHWMSTGVPFSLNHTDLTNYYIHMGVLCGLPCVILIIYAIIKSLFMAGELMKTSPQHSKTMWALGCYLTVHALSGISVSYTGKSYLFLFLGIAAIVSSYTSIQTEDNK